MGGVAGLICAAGVAGAGLAGGWGPTLAGGMVAAMGGGDGCVAALMVAAGMVAVEAANLRLRSSSASKGGTPMGGIAWLSVSSMLAESYRAATARCVGRSERSQRFRR